MLASKKERGFLIIDIRYIYNITLINSAHLKHAVLSKGRQESCLLLQQISLVSWKKPTMKTEVEEEQEEEEDTSNFRKEEEANNDEPDPWSPLRKNVRDLKEPYLKEVQQFMEMGKSQAFLKVLLSIL